MTLDEYRKYCLEVRAKELAEHMVHDMIEYALEDIAKRTAEWVRSELSEVLGEKGAKYFGDQVSERIMCGGESPH